MPLIRQSSPAPRIVTAADGTRFLAAPARYRQVFEVPEYRFDDLRPEDRVLDIGANVGAFALRAARLSHLVVAVEPVAYDLLAANVRLNGAEVPIIRGALGSGMTVEVRWDDEAVTVPSYPLREIVRMAGGCDFLKCDCEGAEWQIDPADLAGVRRLEMELHLPPISGPSSPALLDAIAREYEFTIDTQPCHGPLGLMGYLHAERKGRERDPPRTAAAARRALRPDRS